MSTLRKAAQELALNLRDEELLKSTAEYIPDSTVDRWANRIELFAQKCAIDAAQQAVEVMRKQLDELQLEIDAAKVKP
jgi:hypothetical protein